ncbi:GFA family protein [Neptuniibacter sp. QD37_6]|uniref:GFA family protein n=1 Tax=Neptuniibacter sp. QD37_6 TaxID=3398210 RepID=UPI0039F4FA1B
MSGEEVYRGSCLCGEVQYEISPPFSTFQYCHCSRCRKTTGSAHASNIIMPPEQFHWTAGETYVGRYEPSDAKHFAVCFCKKCGSNLPWLAQTGKAMIIPAGTLDTGPEVPPERNLFWGSRADWYQTVNQLDAFDTLPGKSPACKIDVE